ncbi:carboxypeptidase-like regulatory domain-containing protein [Hymenobacter edaphi]|uniref:Carboxypeptidase regulatory-like domain-containing protein n=1 Tax=Hymenobacter edaphi TaxID=2211146 RepID=A0A328BM43_9BACT|nr:carboxypeptidase-like regulatory domain-containing protein [Hymenobacter edaphi]RAK68183.1 hypothetical protein DLM85_09095 [Hymenobacter edaphi]
MAQGDLALVLPLAWQQYQQHQERFAAYKRGYTPELATKALAELQKAQQMPGAQARGAASERTRGGLVTQADEFLAAWQLLDGYIEEANPEPGAYRAMRDAAGYRHYEAAAKHDWTALEQLMAAALAYVQQYAAELADRGEMPGTFAAELAEEAADVRTLLRQFMQEKGAAQAGTTTQQTALLAQYEAYQKMNRDAQRIFRKEPELARQFQTEYLLSLVRGTGQAAARGTLTDRAGQPAAGVLVQATGRDDFAVSDEDGRFLLPLPAGTYSLTLSGAGITRQELPGVVIEPGVKKRVDATVTRAAV